MHDEHDFYPCCDGLRMYSMYMQTRVVMLLVLLVYFE